VTIFAWVEGDIVHTQSKFSGGKPAKHATVLVYDDEGNRLLEGVTDDEGEFSFALTKRTGLTVALKASMGHGAEWRISAEEMTGEPSDMTDTATAQPSENVSDALDGPLPKSHGDVDRTVVVSGTGLSREEMKTLVDDALETKLAPIVKLLAASVERGPTMADIVGGLGYIVGLMGVALYFTNRNRRK
jgi:nickel transport protein